MAVDSLNAGHIDWEHWLNKSRILLEDGLWLSMPSPMEPYPYLASEKDIFNKEHVERREIALAWIEKGLLPKEVYKDAQAREYLVPPVEFFSLAEQAGWIDPLNREHDPIFKFLHSIQTLRAQWLCSKPAYVTREEIGEIFHGTRVEWEFISVKMENDILQGRLNAEIAVKQERGFKVIDSLTDRLEIRNGWLGDGWVKYTIKTADAAAWFKSKYEIPADSMLWRLFDIPQTRAFRAPESQTGDDWQNDSTLTKGEKQRLAILEVIKIKGYDPMQIPDGEKGSLRTICESEYPLLFDGDTSFDNRWKSGSGKNWQMANHASFAKRGKQ